jgi:outer membrane cobalamin receptor
MAAGLGASLATAGPAAARSTPANTTATDLGAVVVTGRLEQDIAVQLAKQGVRVDVVTAAEIKNGQYVDVAQSLRTTAPGLYIEPKNGPFDYVQLSLQGSRTTDVLWLVDGVRINNRLYGGTTPLDTLPASMRGIDNTSGFQGGPAPPCTIGTSAGRGRDRFGTSWCSPC